MQSWQDPALLSTVQMATATLMELQKPRPFVRPCCPATGVHPPTHTCAPVLFGPLADFVEDTEAVSASTPLHPMSVCSTFLLSTMGIALGASGRGHPLHVFVLGSQLLHPLPPVPFPKPMMCTFPQACDDFSHF